MECWQASLCTTVMDCTLLGCLPLWLFDFHKWRSLHPDCLHATFLCLFLQVYNFLPTVSSAVGHHTLQSAVWRTAIGLHSPQRVLAAFLYYQLFGNEFNRPHISPWLACLNTVSCLASVTEVGGLLTLTMVSSSDYFREYLETLRRG